MATTSIYLNFNRNTEEAFNFYKSVFGGEFAYGGIARLGDFPLPEGMPSVALEDKNLIMHIALPILGGTMLMGSDISESMGFNINIGNNFYICLDPNSKIETDRLFDALSAGGKVMMPLQETFWEAYHGTCIDKFRIQWMFNCIEK